MMTSSWTTSMHSCHYRFVFLFCRSKYVSHNVCKIYNETYIFNLCHCSLHYREVIHDAQEVRVTISLSSETDFVLLSKKYL